MHMPEGRSPLRRSVLCPPQERREWNDSVSCKEPASRPSARGALKDGSRFTAAAADMHSSRTALSSTAPQLNSPTLMRLRRGSVAELEDAGGKGRAARVESNIEAKQRVLVNKHLSAKSTAHQVVGVGGGVTMWPGMDDMRLSQREVLQLTVVAACLIAGSVCLFVYMHGPLLSQLKGYAAGLRSFSATHPVIVDQTEDMFVQSLRHWHRSLHQLLVRIDSEVNVKWRAVSPLYSTFWILYLVGAVCLLYFFIASVFAKDRLTPRRIKIWVSLLCVISTWTCLATVLLLRGLAVEEAVRTVISELSDNSVSLIESGWSLQLYQVVLLHWRSKCLPPSDQGLLLVMGLLRLQDLLYYLQYYSVPLLTAILAPIVKIIASLKTVYSH